MDSFQRPIGFIDFFFETLLVAKIDDAVISSVGWAKIESCVVLEGQHFTSEL